MYSPADQEAREALDKRLDPLKKTNFIQTWDEAQILPGTDSETEINRHLFFGRDLEKQVHFCLIVLNDLVKSFDLVASFALPPARI